MPRHPYRAASGDRHGGGVLGGGPRRAARRAGGRGGVHRRGDAGAELPQNRRDGRRLPRERRAGGAPRLRIPLREPCVQRGGGGRGRRVHRPAAGRHRVDGRQDHLEAHRAGGRGPYHSGPRRRRARRGRRGSHRARGRLSGDAQGERRRRREGDADCPRRRRMPRGIRTRGERGALELRRRSPLHRAVHRGAAPHRDPGARGSARERRAPRRARVLDPAPAPEDHRGGAVAVHRSADPPRDGRAGGRPRASGRLRVGRHRGVHRRSRTPVLFPGDEHAPAGRASDHRDGDRRRSRRVHDPDRGGRAHRFRAERRDPPGLGDGSPRVRGESLAWIPAVDGPARELCAAAAHARRPGRYRRARRRGDLDLLRSDDRQARHPGRYPGRCNPADA